MVCYDTATGFKVRVFDLGFYRYVFTLGQEGNKWTNKPHYTVLKERTVGDGSAMVEEAQARAFLCLYNCRSSFRDFLRNGAVDEGSRSGHIFQNVDLVQEFFAGPILPARTPNKVRHSIEILWYNLRNSPAIDKAKRKPRFCAVSSVPRLQSAPKWPSGDSQRPRRLRPFRRSCLKRLRTFPCRLPTGSPIHRLDNSYVCRSGTNKKIAKWDKK